MSTFTVCASVSTSFAEQVVIIAPQTIWPDATTITPTGSSSPVPLETAEIVVRGTTLTMNGSFNIASLTVERSGATPGIVTHGPDQTDVVDGLYLNVSGYVTVEGSSGGVASRIDVNGMGKKGSQGDGRGESDQGRYGGGGGYGGAGSDARSSSQADNIPGLGGGCYGSPLMPTLLGSGGGNAYRSDGTPDANSGGKGGGAIRLQVGGTLTVDGIISADGSMGQVASSSYIGGGGSGGSIHITCGTLAGSINGSITAKGGGSSSNYGGGGGGGRIAVEYSDSTFAGTMDARGALGSGGLGSSSEARGGAGTVFTRRGSALGKIVIDNGNNTGETTEFDVATSLDAHVEIRNGGRLGPKHQQTDFDVCITGDLTIVGGATPGAVYANGRGFFGDQGPEKGGSSHNGYGGGGGYGGAGSDARSSSQADNIPGLGGGCYGSPLMPTLLGSGGGNAYRSDGTPDANSGGKGGGAIRLQVGGTLTVDGIISADGSMGQVASSSYIGGGGSGGSIHITCGTLAGSINGSITAKGGGSSSNYGGGGGGGRIAVEYSDSTFAGTMDARGALGSGGLGSSSEARGGAGTVFTQQGIARGTIVIDNGANLGETTEFDSQERLDANVEIRRGGRLGPKHQQTDFDVCITGDLTIVGGATPGAVYANGRGFFGDQGPEKGGSSHNGYGGGGGYGGAGSDARSSSQADNIPGLGGGCYGSPLMPTLLGSGGGNAYRSDGTPDANSGGKGGGAIRLQVGGTLTVDGIISADGSMGQVGSSSYIGGGGSGGSIYITCDTLAGSIDGSITANGGGSSSNYGGGGGGGRIAVEYSDSTFAGRMDALGALGSGGLGSSSEARGGAGTVFTRRGSALGKIVIDNGNYTGETTEFDAPTSLDAHVEIRNGGRLGPKHQQTDFDVRITGNLTIEGGATPGAVYANGRGFFGDQGPGMGESSQGVYGGGGGYGGAGGNGNATTPGGGTYGSITEPFQLGSGGGNAYRSNGIPDVNSGGKGGGAIRIQVDGTLTVDGIISANGSMGQVASSNYVGGGGSGGSIHITCGTLAGSINGSITANGGGSTSNYGGGGGGGRIAVYSPCLSSDVRLLASGGGSGTRAGSAGTRRWSEPVSGDMNGDGTLNMTDLAEFMGVLLLDQNVLGQDASLCRVGTADVNGDGVANGQDAQAFLALLMTP